MLSLNTNHTQQNLYYKYNNLNQWEKDDITHFVKKQKQNIIDNIR